MREACPPVSLTNAVQSELNELKLTLELGDGPRTARRKTPQSFEAGYGCKTAPHRIIDHDAPLLASIPGPCALCFFVSLHLGRSRVRQLPCTFRRFQ